MLPSIDNNADASQDIRRNFRPKPKPTKSTMISPTTAHHHRPQHATITPSTHAHAHAHSTPSPNCHQPAQTSTASGVVVVPRRFLNAKLVTGVAVDMADAAVLCTDPKPPPPPLLLLGACASSLCLALVFLPAATRFSPDSHIHSQLPPAHQVTKRHQVF